MTMGIEIESLKPQPNLELVMKVYFRKISRLLKPIQKRVREREREKKTLSI